MDEEVQPVDDDDRGSPDLAGRQGFDLAVKVASGARGPKTLAPMTHTRTTYLEAAGTGRPNVTEHPGGVS
jgi:hypothetical protein